jgi:hypothetical protein
MCGYVVREMFTNALNLEMEAVATPKRCRLSIRPHSDMSLKSYIVMLCGWVTSCSEDRGCRFLRNRSYDVKYQATVIFIAIAVINPNTSTPSNYFTLKMESGGVPK